MLLNEPGARLGIENLSINAGPIRVEGYGRMLPPTGGSPTLEAHIVARGIDSAIATMQGNPEAIKIIPLVYLAKGMARPQGDALVWDVSFSDGAVKVNGTPLGESATSPPSQSPTASPQQKRRKP